MRQSRYDGWISTQDEDPIFFNLTDPVGLNFDWSIERAETDADCEKCNQAIGLLPGDEPGEGAVINYWQMDVDGEHLLCEDCYDDVTREI